MPNKLKRDMNRADPQNQSRVVVEGVDEPKRGRDYDKAKIDPFTRKWFYQHETAPGRQQGTITKT